MYAIASKVLEQHIAILGKTGSGKTVTAKGIVEGLLRKGERVCVIDPVSAWWGLRSDEAGHSRGGFPVVIFGGQHGDVQIGASHGAAIAEIVATSDTPTIIDLKTMSVKDRTQFFTSFAVAIMQKNQGVLHMVIDEAHLFAPKGRVNSNQAGEMLSETNNLVTGGRGIGLRFILLTQRPAKLHNDCLASVETLIAMRLTLPADRDAVEAWMKECASVEQGKEILASMPRLQTGEGWIWSPESDILQRVKFPMIQTFDSSNPKNLHRSAKVSLSSINLPEIEKRLQVVAQNVLDNDPKRLRTRIAELERSIRDTAANTTEIEIRTERIEVPAINDDQITRLEAVAVRLDEAIQAVMDAGLPVAAALQGLTDNRQRAERKLEQLRPPMPRPMPAARMEKILHSPPSNGKGTDSSIGGLARKVLTVLAQYPDGMPIDRLAVLATSTVNGHFNNTLGNLRSSGYVTAARVTPIQITREGLSALGHYDPMPTGEDLRRYWLNRMGAGLGSKILRALIENYPHPLALDQLAEAAGSTVNGHFNNTVGSLRTMGLMTPARTPILASEHLFTE